MRTQFKEADIAAVGGLSPKDRQLPAIMEIMDLAVVAVPAFKEAVGGGGGGSLKRWFGAASHACRQLREANSETTLGFLLRKGIQTIANDWYRVAEKHWPDYCLTAGSNNIAEWYAPLYHSELPTPVARGNRFPEARVTGEDSQIVNIKFGQIYPFDRELFDDDQTGQIQQYSQKLGDGMAITESVWSASRLLGPARTYANLTVPASTYATIDINGAAVTTPFSGSLYGATVGNRLQTYGELNMGRLARAYVIGMNAVDPLQNKVIVNLNTLVVSSMDSLRGQVLLQAGPWPAVLGPSEMGSTTTPVLGGTQTFTGAANQGIPAGFAGGWGSPNPFAGLGIKLVIERYLADWAWVLMEKGKGLIFQQRDGLEIIEEGRNTGSYFDFDSIRYRSRERFNVDWVGGGSRFAVAGNDGTATGTL